MSVRKAPSAKYSAASSACASTITQLVMVPCETIKVQLQIFQKVKVKGESPLANSLRFIYRNEGILGFWRGYFVSLSCSIPSCAIYYSSFETLRRMAYAKSASHPKLTPFIPAITSSLAQLLTCLVMSPVDRFRTQYWAARGKKVSELLHETAAQVQREGVQTLYHGLKPLLIRDIAFSSIYWSIYEQLRTSAQSLGLSPVLQNLIAGSVGGMATTAVITPFDVVKTRQQVLETRESIWCTLKMIASQEGVRGLFRGMTPRVIQTAPTMSIMMIVYDGINRFILH
ncbi:hypothetical protein WA556_001337, partial [Blastocystis sp. ATCC 50177/Nand II]